VRIYYEDTDSGGVVYYANYLKFMERARTEWLRALGYDQDVLAARHGVIFAVRSVAVEFIKPARFNDLLHVSAAVTHIGRASLSFEQQVSRVVDERDGESLASGHIRIVCLEARSFKLRSIPSNLKKDLESAG
jgi:acyl-CoA thioester hydrolase